jgi:hypothetical protein
MTPKKTLQRQQQKVHTTDLKIVIYPKLFRFSLPNHDHRSAAIAESSTVPRIMKSLLLWRFPQYYWHLRSEIADARSLVAVYSHRCLYILFRTIELCKFLAKNSPAARNGGNARQFKQLSMLLSSILESLAQGFSGL